MTLDEVARELYAEPLERFVQARDHRAKELRAGGDAALAKQVKQLRKPSTGAWLVNMLVRRLADEVEQVLGLGAELRAAQASLDADTMRALEPQRRHLTAAVTAQARALGRELGHDVTDQVAAQVEGTLRAAMADAGAAAAVRNGTLTEPLSPAGFGALDDAGVLATVSPLRKPPPRPQPHSTAKESALAQAQGALADAKARLDEADRRVAETRGRADEARARLQSLEEELTRLRERVRAVEQDVIAARREAGRAQKVQGQAERAGAAAEQALADAEARLDRLGSAR